ncbi:MAG: HAD-IA family hydrolase [Acidimicrobiia bacterium]
MSRQAEAVALLLLDLDETLLDRTSTFRRWAIDFCRSCGEDKAAMLWLIEQDQGGYRPKEEFVRAVNERLAPREPLTVDGFRRSFAELFRCDPSVLAALSRVRAGGWDIGVVTNGSPAQLEKVAVSGLSDAVDVVCVSEIEGCRKPDPRLLRIAASRIGATLEGAWLVGDNPVSDIGAAAAAGIPSVWLRLGRRWEIEKFRPTAQADDVVTAIGIATSL